MRNALFFDSWAWITLSNSSEEKFQEIQTLYQEQWQAQVPLITTDYVLDEVITFLYPRSPSSIVSKFINGLFSSIEAGNIQLERITPDRFEKAWHMRLKYHDHPKISFTDFTSFVVMRERQVSRVVTNDHHFLQVNLGFEKVP